MPIMYNFGFRIFFQQIKEKNLSSTEVCGAGSEHQAPHKLHPTESLANEWFDSSVPR